MALFDFVENFFFISLGITFALILLLIYHFKQRISSVERKGDTMYELMTNIVKELKFVKGVNSYYESFFRSTGQSLPGAGGAPLSAEPAGCPVENGVDKKVIHYPVEGETKSTAIQVVKHLPCEEEEAEPAMYSKIMVSDDDSGSDSDSDSESESGVEEESVYLEDTESVEEFEDGIALGEIELEWSGRGKEDYPTPTPAGLEEVLLPEEFPLEHPAVLVSEISVPTTEEEPSSSSSIALPESVANPITDPVTEKSNEKDPEGNREIYRKMNITQLRSIAHAVGIDGDLAKMKKNEIIRLLERISDAKTGIV